MTLDERLAWLTLGCLIGFAVGYIVRGLRETKEEMHEVHEIVKNIQHEERGAISIEMVKNVALFVVVVATVWAAFVSQASSNDVKDNQAQLSDTQDQLADAQHRIELITSCNQSFLNRTIVALNARTTYSVDQASANVDLQRAQARYLGLVRKIPPLTDEKLQAALEEYFQALQDYVQLAGKTAIKQETNPYPTPEQLQSCLDEVDTKETQDE